MIALWAAVALGMGPAVVNHGPRDRKRVALTFDACSGPPPGKLDLAVVAALEAAAVKATFFVGGAWAEQDPARVQRLLADPRFEVESHAYHHPHLLVESDRAIRGELQHGIAALTPQLGRAPVYLRAPYGEADGRLARLAAGLGLTVIGFDLPSGDPDPHFDKARLVRWVLAQVRPGSIIVMHANGRGWHTAEALPAILAGIEHKGLELVTMAELLATAPDGGAGN